MNVLLDECLPRRLKNALPGHAVETVIEAGWSGTKNGELLRRAVGKFDVFLTADQNLTYQQNLSGTKLAVVILVASNNRLQTLKSLMPKVLQSLSVIRPGEVLFIEAKALREEAEKGKH